MTNISTTGQHLPRPYSSGKELLAHDPNDLPIPTDDCMKAWREGKVTNPRAIAACEARDKWERRDDWEHGDAPWIELGEDGEPLKPIDAERAEAYEPTCYHDAQFNPIIIFDWEVFPLEDLTSMFNFAIKAFGDYGVGTLRVTLRDRDSGRTLYESQLHLSAHQIRLWHLRYDVEQVFEDHEGHIELIFHSAPLPNPGTEIVGAPQGGLLSFLEEELPELDFVIHGAARGEYGVCVAPPSSYKTTFVQNLCMSLATGRPFEPFTMAEPGEHVETTFNTAVAKPRRVVYLDFENGQSFAQGDLKTMVRGGQFNAREMELLESNYYPIIDPQVRMGSDPDSDTLACLSDEETVQMIIERINARFGEGQTDIVVIDTQAEGFDLEDENSNGANGAGAIARAVNRIKRQTGAFVLLVSHTAKNGEEANQSAERSVRGASRVADKSRFTLKIEQFKDSGGRVVPHHIVVTNVKAKGPKLSDGAKLHFTHDPKTRWMSFEYGGPVQQLQIPYTADPNEPTDREAWLQWRMDTTGCKKDAARAAWNRKSK
jgi:hypothetical protein